MAIFKTNLEVILASEEEVAIYYQSAIKQIYPSNISEEKLKLLNHRINLFEKSKEPIVKLFKRYLLNFRIRLVHKATLIILARMARESNNIDHLNALKETELVKYLPPQSLFASKESSVFFNYNAFAVY